MLDFIERLIVPGPPDTDCIVTDLKGKFKRIIAAPPCEIKLEGAPAPIVNAERKNGRKRGKKKGVIGEYDWDVLIPLALERLKAGCTLRQAAEATGAPYSALSWQICRGPFGEPIREWRTEHREELRERERRAKSEAAKRNMARQRKKREGIA